MHWVDLLLHQTRLVLGRRAAREPRFRNALVRLRARLAERVVGPAPLEKLEERLLFSGNPLGFDEEPEGSGSGSAAIHRDPGWGLVTDLSEPDSAERSIDRLDAAGERGPASLRGTYGLLFSDLLDG